MRARRLPFVTALVVLTAGLWPAWPTSAQASPSVEQPPAPSGCAAPYRTSFAAVTYPAPPMTLPWAGGTQLDHALGPLDTDGDGVADTVTDLPDGAIRITRRSGSLEFPRQTFFVNRREPGDLDGDGRTDLILLDSEADAGLYIVLGSTSDGPVDLTSEGIRLSIKSSDPKIVGDQTGDGRDDVAMTTPDPGRRNTEIYSGAALAAPGPGGTFSGSPVETIAGELLGRVPFGSGAPALVTSADSQAGGSDVAVTLHGDPEVELTTAGSGVSLRPTGNGYSTDVHAVLDEGHVWIVLFQISRSGSDTWGWQLDDLCNTESLASTAPTLRPAPTTPPATPAPATPVGPTTRPAPTAPAVVAVHGKADFTG